MIHAKHLYKKISTKEKKRHEKKLPTKHNASLKWNPKLVNFRPLTFKELLVFLSYTQQQKTLIGSALPNSSCTYTAAPMPNFAP